MFDPTTELACNSNCNCIKYIEDEDDDVVMSIISQQGTSL